MSTRRALLYTTLVVVALAVIEVCVIRIAIRFDIRLGDNERGTVTAITGIILLLAAAVISTMAFVVLVATGFVDTYRSPLYYPFTILCGALAIILCQTSIGGVAFLRNDLRPHPTVLMEPEVRLWGDLLFFLVTVALAWITVLVVLSRIQRRRDEDDAGRHDHDTP